MRPNRGQHCTQKLMPASANSKPCQTSIYFKHTIQNIQ